MDLSRRTFLTSAAALAVVPFPRTPVICSLEESRDAFTRAISFRGLLVESGVGFAADNLGWLRLWGISIGEPREVRGPAWVRFDWPIPAMIRDFGRVCPIHGGTVIARLDNMPVAVRQGGLVVLGSPIGPHLYAGDWDAHKLLEALIGQTRSQAPTIGCGEQVS
jgi:hypothetical protein